MPQQKNGFLEKLRKPDASAMAQVRDIMRNKKDPDTPYNIALYLLGCLMSLFTVGALWGFKRAYNRLELADNENPPTFSGKPLSVYITMAIGAVLGFLIPVIFIGVSALATGLFMDDRRRGILFGPFGWLLANLVITLISLFFFRKWQTATYNYIIEKTRHGNARFALPEDLAPYRPEVAKYGSWIGGGNYYKEAGHTLTVAGTRGGKGVNLIIPNLLSLGRFLGSWVVVDPKGENAAVTANYQRSQKKKVIFLNPWNLLNLGQSTYNPLDLLKLDIMNLSDDVMMIAEAIVPMTAQGDTQHFDNRARTIIAGLILHLVSAAPVEKRHLATLWEWLRLPKDVWSKLLDEMSENKTPAAGEIVHATANEIVSLMEQGQKEYASVMSTAQKWTDFLKSPALRKSLTPDATALDSATLSDGETVVYVIIPAERLKTHAQWLRLVTTSLMRAVVRRPNRDVCFLLDEFYALGYLSEIEIALGSYAGYGVHLHAVLQNLVQLRDAYGDNWENFISSCSVRQFFNLSDVMTSDYVSHLLGTTSIPTYDALGNLSGASGRQLVNPDELRLTSNENIYMIVDDVNPAKVPKMPYFDLLTEGKDFDKNPYYELVKKQAKENEERIKLMLKQ